MKSQLSHLFIRTDANSQVGIGHLMRCFALAQAWKKEGGRVTFITSCENDKLQKQILKEDFKLVLIDKSWPESDDLEVTLSNIKDSQQVKPWVVIDGYHFDTDYQQCIKNNSTHLMVIDDTAHLNHYVADIILNQNINAQELNYTCDPSTELLLGKDFVLLREEFLEWQGWHRDIPKIGNKVLVVFGGSDNNNQTFKVIQALEQVEMNGLKVKVVLGAYNLYIDSLKSAVENSSMKFQLFHNANNMPELMAWADISVSATGSTCWEIAFLGLPTILIVTAENQNRVAERLSEYGSAINLGWHSDVSREQIKKNISFILKDFESRIKMSQLGRELVDGNGPSHTIRKMDNFVFSRSLNKGKLR